MNPIRRLLPLLCYLAYVGAPVLIAAMIAGCGGGSTSHSTAAATSHTTPAPLVRQAVQAPPSHPCNAADQTMQCVLSAQAPPSVKQLTQQFASSVADGEDFAWSCPNPTGVKDFGASYLSPDTSKNWTLGCINWWHQAHRATVMVYESTATRAGEGCGAGRADALLAAHQAAALGNTSRPIDFAIDYQADPKTLAPYFTCVKQVLGAREGAYGGYDQVGWLCSHGLVNHTNWQTYAWSGGRWLPASCAPLEQYLNTSTVDFDRAIAKDYGQSPGPVAPPPPDPYAVLPKHPWTIDGMKLSEYNTVKTWDRQHCLNPVRRQVCKATHYHLQLLSGRVWEVAHASHPPNWNFHRGIRFKFMWDRLHQTH